MCYIPVALLLGKKAKAKLVVEESEEEEEELIMKPEKVESQNLELIYPVPDWQYISSSTVLSFRVIRPSRLLLITNHLQMKMITWLWKKDSLFKFWTTLMLNFGCVVLEMTIPNRLVLHWLLKRFLLHKLQTQNFVAMSYYEARLLGYSLQGYVPPSYLTQKKEEAKPDKRSTQEQFREEVLKLTDKAQEANMKKR